MKLYAMIALGAAALPAAASGQTVSPPVPWEDTPQVRLNVPGGGVAARAAVAAPAPVAPRPAAVPAAALAGPATMAPPPAAKNAARVHHQRLTRGHKVGGFWRGSNVHVRDPGAYGLYPPASGRRWVRYYDDALLIDDRSGMVEDGRYGLDWDRYPAPWGEDRGIPVYVGDGDYRPDGEDMAYVDDWNDEQRYADGGGPVREHGVRYEERDHRGGHQEREVRYGHHDPRVRYNYDAYPYGNPYPYGAVVTETTVTTAPIVSTRTYYVEEEVRTTPRRHVKAKRRTNCAAECRPAVHYGEKG